MSLQPVTAVNCAGLLQPGCSLLQLDGDIFLFGQKGWPKRSCPTGVFSIRLKKGQLKLRAISFSNDSCYLPPLRSPAIAHLDSQGSDPECYLIHGGRTPNNELSPSLYMLGLDSRGCNRKVTLRCREKELTGEVPGPRYGHTLSVVRSRGKTACFGCCSAHLLPELTDGQAFHLALAREDCVYFLGGHTMASDSRPPRLFRLRVELLLGSPLLSCESLDSGLSLTSAIATRVCLGGQGSAHEYIILGGYRSESEKRLECSRVVLDDAGIRIEPREPPGWTGEISHSRTCFGRDGDGNGEGEDPTQGCSQESTDFEDSAPLEDSEELYFGREPHELEDSSDGGEGDTYNEEDEEDESQTGYWIKCCPGCLVDPNTWEPYYSTELCRPAMIFCSRGEEGHWVHAQCMDLPEELLLQLSQNSSKYYCLDHGGIPWQEPQTPPRNTSAAAPLKRTPMKTQHRKAPVKLKMTPAKKTFFRRLFN
ncbi:hypothetical protein JZ751_004173 [Albula glossodonta]|uniref:V(D)J recombination-activating protein 2 n=1 Tax=Albula glossodonta TaxID=121402 RepID=A0A8T2N6X6_9TELE|nr:hypothetical protein JZ751_004173 [Albula glossodonta]